MRFSRAAFFRAVITSILVFLAIFRGISDADATSSGGQDSAYTSLAPPSYADLADLVTQAPLAAKAQVTKAKILENGIGGAPPAGYQRLLIEAHVLSLIRGEGGVSPQITYLADVAVDAAGHIPKLRKSVVLLFARPGPNGQSVQLLSRRAQMAWTADREATVRAITTELLAQDAPPRIVAVGDAFHLAGTVAGESETQIFLKTENGTPISLSVVRRPDAAPRWGVSLGEIVDEAAAPPAPNTLLWYRLACGLPGRLPPEAVRTLPLLDAEAAQRDYAFVQEGLGTCGRTL
jgi:hypothetical protein